MPTIAIAKSTLGPAVAGEVRERERLLDVCDRLRAPVSFSCRSATCGTCLVDILEGEALLDPAGPEEREVLALFEATPSQRLACQAVIRAEPGAIRMAWIEAPDAPPAKRLPG
ncbi:MAG: 2Fe-2S iron-sulfur cluster-binding protein [Minicystis sp.]